MDPRNPLGRLDALSRRPAVRRLTLEFAGTGGGEVTRGVELELVDGRRGEFHLHVGSSWIDLLDRIQAFIEKGGASGGRERLPVARDDARIVRRRSESRRAARRIEARSIGGAT